jgi:hypothetical protein
MTLSEVLVCFCTLFNPSSSKGSFRNAVILSCIRAHNSGSGSWELGNSESAVLSFACFKEGVEAEGGITGAPLSSATPCGVSWSPNRGLRGCIAGVGGENTFAGLVYKVVMFIFPRK